MSTRKLKDLHMWVTVTKYLFATIKHGTLLTEDALHTWLMHRVKDSSSTGEDAHPQLEVKTERCFVLVFCSAAGKKWRSESRPRAMMMLSTKWLCPCRDYYFLYTLDYIAAILRSPIYTLHGLAVCSNNLKLCCLFSGWFAKEANVANNKQPLANFMTQSQRQTGMLWMLRDRNWRQTCNSEGWRPSIQEHTI